MVLFFGGSLVFMRNWWRLYKRPFQPLRAQAALPQIQVLSFIYLKVKQSIWFSLPSSRTTKTLKTRSSFKF